MKERSQFKMTISPLTREAIDFVMDNISEEELHEMKVFGRTAEKLRSYFYKQIGAPFAAAYYDNHGVCHVIGAMETLGIYEWRTHYVMGKDGAKVIGFALTRFLSKITDKMIQENNGTGYIEILSAFHEGKVRDWFEAMGFKLAETEGLVNRYIKKGVNHVRQS